jgi:glycosyltransferase involved in cell wall biosynthesis
MSALAAAFPSSLLAVWSLAERRPAFTAGRAVTWGAAGSRLGFAAHSVAGAFDHPRRAIVIVMHAHLLPLAAPMMARGASVVSVLVGIEAWRRFSPLRARLYRRAHRRIAISAHTAREFRAANPALSACDIDICRPSLPPLAPALAARVAPQGPYALIVGRMASTERYKGHDRLLDVWSSVTAAVPEARLVIAGDGDDRPRLEARSRQLQLGGAVHFAGAVEPAALAALYRDAAMLVLPSPREGFGLVLLEAMSCGRACIAAPGAAQEIIDDGDTGLIVDPGQPQALAAAIVRLFRDPASAAAMGSRARRRVHDAFTPRRFADDLARVVGPIVDRAAAC